MTEYEKLIARVTRAIQVADWPPGVMARHYAIAAYAAVLAALSENPPEGALDAIPNCEGTSRNSRAVMIWRAQLEAAPRPMQRA